MNESPLFYGYQMFDKLWKVGQVYITVFLWNVDYSDTKLPRIKVFSPVFIGKILLLSILGSIIVPFTNQTR